MTHPDSDKKSSLVRWKWPVDPTVYDRSPALSDAERASLGSLIKCFDAHHPFWPEHARENLDRLLRPINDVLDYLAIHNVNRRRLITNTLLREMHDRRQSFWGWTRDYAKIMLAKLTQSYAQAGYFERNRRLIDVLVDQEAVKSGAAAQGESWKYYDLGHGYCSYDFFDQCPHRMACAKCSFYVPKGSSRAQLLEAKTNLQRLKQEIPLTEAECAAIEDGLEAVERLCARLADIPTPAGPTPHELGAVARHSLPIISKLSMDEK